MNKVLILSTQDEAPSYSDRMKVISVLGDTLAEAGIESKVTLFENLVFSFTDGKLTVFDNHNDVDLADFDFVYIKNWQAHRDAALALARYLLSKDIKVIPSENFTSQFTTKISEAFSLILEDIPYPDTLFCPKSRNLATAINSSSLEYPIIVKAVDGSAGNDNYLVKSEEELLKIITDNDDVSFMAQNFIENDGDHRILLFGYEPKMSFHRKSAGDSHLNNTSQGGEANMTSLSEYSEKVLADSIKAAKIAKREIAGVDVLYDSVTGEHYILEVNSSPQLSTGAFVDEKQDIFLQYIKQELN